MKKNDSLLIIGTVLFSFLFYNQSAGLNVFLYSLIIPLLLGIYKPDQLRNRLWILGALLTIITGFSVFVNGTFLALSAFYLSVSYLAGVSVSHNASPLSAISYATFSYSTSVGYMVADAIERRKTFSEREKKKIKWNSVILLTIFVFLVVMVFFFLYQTANPLFKEITKFIRLDFISLRWVMFTFLGFLLVYGLLYTRFIKQWDEYESINNQTINPEKVLALPNKFLWFSMDEQLERKSGIILFVLLNIMILIINVLDISFLWSGIQLPEGFTFAGYLHQGIYTLIFSCLLAILLILFIFRGKINFLENNHSLKILAIIWIAQNIFIALSCALRNYLYISHYALTYKRIIIFFFLILLIVGLTTTLIKILRAKNLYYLFRFNSFAFLFIFIGFSLFNWDGIITRYNIKHSTHPDIAYLIHMNHSGLPALLKYAEKHNLGQVADFSKLRSSSFFTPESFYWQQPTLTEMIYDKTYRLLEKHQQTSWKSFNLTNAFTIRKIKKMYDEGQLTQFIIHNKENVNFQILTRFKGLKHLSIHNANINDSTWIQQLKVFDNLEQLELTDQKLQTLDNLPDFNKLKTVNFSQNFIKDFSILSKYPNLTQVNISKNPTFDIGFIQHLTNIEHLNISETNIVDLSVLSNMPLLSHLTIRNMQKADFSTLQQCPNLKYIDLSENVGLGNFKNIPGFISGAKHLETLFLKNTGMNTLNVFSDTVVVMKKITLTGVKTVDEKVLSNIMYLNVDNNNLKNLDGIRNFRGLKILSAQNNDIIDIRKIASCKNLVEADLSLNPVASLNGIKFLKNLQFLHFSSFKFNDISELSALEKLEALTLSNGNIDNPEVLKNLQNLKYLDISYTFIPSLSFLDNMPKLEFLNLTGYTGSDFEHILKCTSLKVLVVPRIPMKLKNKLEREIPQIKIIRDWEFANHEFYKTKYGTVPR